MLIFPLAPGLAWSLAFEVPSLGDVYRLWPGAEGSLKERFSRTRERFSRTSAEGDCDRGADVSRGFRGTPECGGPVPHGYVTKRSQYVTSGGVDLRRLVYHRLRWGGGCTCDTRAHVVSGWVKEVQPMPDT